MNSEATGSTDATGVLGAVRLVPSERQRVEGPCPERAKRVEGPCPERAKRVEGRTGGVACAVAVLARIACALLLVEVSVAAAQTPVSETLGEVRVHGNHTTPDEEVLALSGLTVGSSITDEMLRQAEARLRSSRRFADVEVRKRYRSIDNPSDILVILLVDELAGVSKDDLTPGPFKRVGRAGMWLPILDYADGYGFTYGARASIVDVVGPRSRISIPMSWGGERKAAVEVDRVFERGPFSRLQGAVAIHRRENPHYLIGDTRREARLRAERALASWLRVGTGVRVTNVRFGDIDERFVAPGVDLVVDTRTDPSFPRNAIHVIAGIEQLRFEGGRKIARRTGEVHGYVGFIGSTVLALRASISHVDAPLPRYEQALLGGTSLVRGYEFGYRASDNLTALSAEVRVPVTSPLSIGRLGVRALFDTGTVYAVGAKLTDQPFDRGVGGGVFFTAPVVGASLDVAWPVPGSGSRSGKPRWHFGLGITF